MIRVLLDNNILDHVQELSDRDDVLNLLEDSQQRKQCLFYFPENGFWELLKGFSEKTLSMRQESLRSVWRLTKGRILLCPSDHLRYSLGFMKAEEYAKRCDDLVKWMRLATKASDYEFFKRFYGRVPDDIRKVCDDYHKETESDHQQLHESVNSAQSTNWFRNCSGDEFFDVVAPALLVRFDLYSDMGHMSPQQISTNAPSLRQFCEIYRVLQRKRLLGAKKVCTGDYFDIQRVPYLDLCDYIISNDRAFASLFADADNCDLEGRVINLSTLIGSLETGTLPARTTSAKWKNASEIRRSLS